MLILVSMINVIAEYHYKIGVQKIDLVDSTVEKRSLYVLIGILSLPEVWVRIPHSHE